MKIGWVILGALALVAPTPAQTPETTRRTREIWTTVRSRLNQQAEVWYHDGDFPRVVQILRFSFSLDPSDYDTGTNLGFMQENIEDYAGALITYTELRTSNPTDPDSAWPEANFYFKRKAYAMAPGLLEGKIVDPAAHPNNYRTLAHAYERMNMLADSKRVWELYLGRHPDDAAAKMNLNRVLGKLKQKSG